MKIASRVKNLFKVRRTLVFYLGDPGDIIPINSKAKISISGVSFDNVEHITDFRSEKHEAMFRKYLEEGECGVYAWLDSKVVGHVWAKVCKRSRCRIKGYMDISQSEAMIHFANVSEEQRGKNIHPSMLVALCRYLFSEEKVNRILIEMEVDNRAALRGPIKVGFKLLCTGTYVKFRGRLLFKYFTSLPNGPATAIEKVNRGRHT